MCGQTVFEASQPPSPSWGGVRGGGHGRPLDHKASEISLVSNVGNWI